MKLHSFALSLFLVGAGCGLHYAVPATSAAVGADVEIDASENRDQGVTRMTVKVKNLPPPERVSEGSTAFVAWQRTAADGAWTRVAALKYDEGARRAELKDATVPAIGFEMQVTAETGPDVAAPSNVVIVSQRIGG